MVALETAVRAIEIDGLHWGASKLIPVAYGVKKLQIMLTIEDALVSSDDIEVYSVRLFPFPTFGCPFRKPSQGWRTTFNPWTLLLGTRSKQLEVDLLNFANPSVNVYHSI